MRFLIRLFYSRASEKDKLPLARRCFSGTALSGPAWRAAAPRSRRCRCPRHSGTVRSAVAWRAVPPRRRLLLQRHRVYAKAPAKRKGKTLSENWVRFEDFGDRCRCQNALINSSERQNVSRNGREFASKAIRSVFRCGGRCTREGNGSEWLKMMFSLAMASACSFWGTLKLNVHVTIMRLFLFDISFVRLHSSKIHPFRRLLSAPFLFDDEARMKNGSLRRTYHRAETEMTILILNMETDEEMCYFIALKSTGTFPSGDSFDGAIFHFDLPLVVLSLFIRIFFRAYDRIVLRRISGSGLRKRLNSLSLLEFPALELFCSISPLAEIVFFSFASFIELLFPGSSLHHFINEDRRCLDSFCARDMKDGKNKRFLSPWIMLGNKRPTLAERDGKCREDDHLQLIEVDRVELQMKRQHFRFSSAIMSDHERKLSSGAPGA